MPSSATHDEDMAQKRNILFAVLFGGALFVTLMVFAIYIAVLVFADRDIGFGESVAVVDVFGELWYDVGKVAEIESYRDNDDVKALLVHINSPGGGVSASQAIYHALLEVRETKPVVAVMGAVAASGGYYIACAADSIVALEGTLTGSIGVIATFMRTEELFEKIGLDFTVIKTGKYKDVGSPHRRMTEAEKVYLGGLLDKVYDQFLLAVSEGRGLPMERVREIAEGRLYSGEAAWEVGLVDRLGTYSDALMLAARMGGIDGEPKVIKKRPHRSWAERFFGKSVPVLPHMGNERIYLQYIIP